MRVTVHSEKQYLDIIRQTWRENCFYAVYSEYQKDCKVYDTIYLEQDYLSLERANRDYDIFLSFLKLRGILPRVYFSGRRSYHYFIDFPPLKIINFKEKVKTWVKTLPISFDVDVIGDTGRMTRVPGSMHETTKLFCVPVNSPVNPKSCVDLEGVKIPEIMPNAPFGMMLRDLKADTHSGIQAKEEIETTKEGGIIPPCIASIMKIAVNTGKCEHHARLHVGTYLLRTEGKEAAYNFFKSMTDFNHQTTIYNLQWLMEHDWHCYVCSRAKELGMCPLEGGKVCTYYPSINWSL